MAAEQIALRHASLRFPFVAILLAVAFAIAIVAGTGVLGAVTTTSLVAVNPGAIVAPDLSAGVYSPTTRAMYCAPNGG